VRPDPDGRVARRLEREQIEVLLARAERQRHLGSTVNAELTESPREVLTAGSVSRSRAVLAGPGSGCGGGRQLVPPPGVRLSSLPVT
jgi:hypothetical protein